MLTLFLDECNVFTSGEEEEEIIAEDYDEDEPTSYQGGDRNRDNSMNNEYFHDFDYENDGVKRKPHDNYWLTQMKTRMGEANSTAGHKGCPNRYNVWHKCTLYCVNRWKEGKLSPSPEYMIRYRRLLKRYPLPEGWVEMYDQGCGCYYFACEADGVVSWLPPTHPKSQVTKSAAVIRKLMEDTNEEDYASLLALDTIETENITSPPRNTRVMEEPADLLPGSSGLSSNFSHNGDTIMEKENFLSSEEDSDSPAVSPQPLRRPKSQDLGKVSSGQKQEHLKSDRKESGTSSFRRGARTDMGTLDPMDPSAYSDVPRGKWSDGLQTASEDADRKKKNDVEKGDKKKHQKHNA